jgi:hypothetical protein
MGDACTLFGAFGWLVQLSLASVCLSSLFCNAYSDKRYREHPRREFSIFMLDISKQGFGAALAHIINVMVAVLFSHWEQDDPCVWYFITLVLDTTAGVLLAILMLGAVELCAAKMAWHKLRSGNYYDSESLEIDLGAWAMQVTVWGVIVSVSKWLVVGLMTYNTKLLSALGHAALHSLLGHPHLELVVVMVLVPTVLNCMQFWVQDNFLKASLSTNLVK